MLGWLWNLIGLGDEPEIRDDRIKLGNCHVCKGIGKLRKWTLLTCPRQFVDNGTVKCETCDGTGNVCQHEWEWKMQPGTVNGPAEHFKICKTCGMEYPGSNV